MANNTMSFEEPNYLKLWQSSSMDFYKYGLFVVIMSVSTLGNGLVFLTILFVKSLRYASNYFLLNLVIADLFVTGFSMTLHFLNWFDSSIMRNYVTCKTAPFFQGLALCCTIYTMIVTAFERYRVLLGPLGTYTTCARCFVIIAIIWILSFLTVSPTLFIYQVRFIKVYSSHICDEFGWSVQHRIAYTLLLAVFNFVIPLLIIFILYSRISLFLCKREIPGLQNLPMYVQTGFRRKYKAGRNSVNMMIIITFTFMVCHLPQNMINFLWYTKSLLNWQPPMYMEIVAYHTQMLLFSNSALNPIIYGVLHGQIKNALVKRFTRKPKKDKNKKKAAASNVATHNENAGKKSSFVIFSETISSFIKSNGMQTGVTVGNITHNQPNMVFYAKSNKLEQLTAEK